MTDRAEILNKAAELIGGDREQDYGSAAENFARIGNLWAEIVGVPISPEQVALCMNQVKVARLINSPDHLDSWIDGAGYLALGGEIATDGVARAFRELRVPRVVESLADDCGDSEWIDKCGDRWRSRRGKWRVRQSYHNRFRATDLRPNRIFGPYTEVIN